MRSPPAPPPPHRRAGFTLVEVLITTVIVGTAFMALGWMVTSANRTQQIYQSESVDVLQLAREIRELALAIRHEPLNGLGTAKTLDDLIALDNLDGASFNPPIRADLTTMTGLSGWTQRVDLTQHGTGDIKKAVSGLLKKPGKGVKEVFLLTVTILEGTEERGDFEWIIKP